LDESLWTKAATAWHAIERPYEEALARWQAGEAAALAGDRARASEHVREALATARRLGSRWLTDELTGLALRARLDLEEIVAAGVETPEDPYGLTVREREVLALIAQGATNRQIGAALFMAEKTASVHVSRILAKLGVHSRTEAAAVAHRGGWLSRDLVAGRPR
jgi:DNA-binding NarL/FixJ family response regulator